MRELGYLTVFSTGSELAAPPDSPWVSAVVARHCPGYDFTSWKAAFTCFPSLYRAREVVLTNDSVFAPFGSFGPVHEAMAAVPSADVPPNTVLEVFENGYKLDDHVLRPARVVVSSAAAE